MKNGKLIIHESYNDFVYEVYCFKPILIEIDIILNNNVLES